MITVVFNFEILAQNFKAMMKIFSFISGVNSITCTFYIFFLMVLGCHSIPYVLDDNSKQILRFLSFVL